jgi:hypothetical protein
MTEETDKSEARWSLEHARRHLLLFCKKESQSGQLIGLDECLSSNDLVTAFCTRHDLFN